MVRYSIEKVNQWGSVVELLQQRASEQPDSPLYHFLTADDEALSLTYGELDRAARGVAAQLQARNVAGEPVLLLYPPGLDYIKGFFGTLYAGAIAVPAYPPQSARRLPRIQAIARNAQPAALLAPDSLTHLLGAVGDQPSDLSALPRVAVAAVGAAMAQAWQPPRISSQRPAFLQYTSGSTAAPKGVVLSHANLLANLELIYRQFQYGPRSHGVIWLPPYHDMGMIGGILEPLYGGFPVTLMSPSDFLQSPLRWLRAISNAHATTSGGPNFAYNLCVRKITDAQKAQLDLSSWSVAFCGAEPIQAETLQRFAEAFAPCGFRRESFVPCYGLAEATLLVSGDTRASGPTIVAFQSALLEQASVSAADATMPSQRQLVGCGQPAPGHQIAIVNPQTNAIAPPDQIGEIWVAGPSVAQGYWREEQASVASFGARLAQSGAGPFLRTGDLGFLYEGELFVTGRIKDLMIIRGRNYSPQDIELTSERCHPLLRPGCGAAFSLEIDGQERVILVQELERSYRHEDLQAIARTIRQKVAEQHELELYGVVFVKPNSIPKTSSGKIQRGQCKAAYRANSLDTLAASVADLSGSDAEEREAQSSLDLRQALHATSLAERSQAIERWLRGLAERLLGLPASDLSAAAPLIALGLDSLSATEIQHAVEATFGVQIALRALLEGGSLGWLAAHIARQRAGTGSLPELPVAPATALPSSTALSFGQRALWFISQLDQESTAYHIANALRINQAVDTGLLRRAFNLLIERHSALRTTFVAPDGEPIQQVHSALPCDFQILDASAWAELTLSQHLAEEASRPFNLASGPLIRVAVFTRSQSASIMLVVIHHIVADFWSLALLFQELGELYSALLDDATIAARPAPPHYFDYIRQQDALLKGKQGERLWAYWKQRLAGELPILNLPTDRPRPTLQTYRGATQRLRLSPQLTAQLKQLAQSEGSTLNMVLLAAYQCMLHRYTGQEDILVGTPVSARSSAQFASTVGYFVNTLVHRSDFSGSPSFKALLGRVKSACLADLEHQDYPFALLVERLQANRDPSRPPLVQAMFIYQQAPRLNAEGLSAFALGEAETQITLGGLSVSSLALERDSAQFDLILSIAEVGVELVALFQYNTDLFDPATIARMQAHFQLLLEGIIASPHTPISRLPMLLPAELEQLTAWNSTTSAYPEATIHALFQAQAARTPEATAVVFEDRQLTYRELDHKSNQLAHYLIAHGAGPESRVGLYLNRSLEMVIGLLGILKAGGAYVPLDPSHPKDRLAYMLHDAGVEVCLTDQQLSERVGLHMPARVIALDTDWLAITRQPLSPPPAAQPRQLAYVMYTSGSTGNPKGVMIEHQSVVSFFVGMDQRIGCDSRDTLLAVTNIAFDISVLELLWTLTRGARVIVVAEQLQSARSAGRATLSRQREMEFSLFYFASDDQANSSDRYRLLLDGARFADQHGFTAVWTPERHFHAFGGLYPNPSVTSAALASITTQIKLRAGSVVLPLHHPVRVAEEWAVVDNLSHGRVAIAFASGWHADDFIFSPEEYAQRKTTMAEGIQTVQRLWRGETVSLQNGKGVMVDIAIFPRPVQPDLPIWITAAGSPDTFVKAGEIGANLLTHLLGQSIEELAQKLTLYRAALIANGYNPQDKRVTLMLHTFIGEDLEAVRELVRKPFTNYLRSSIDLISSLVKTMDPSLDLKTISDADMEGLLRFACDRYFETSALFGTQATCQVMIERLRAVGVDEIACLIDFGVEAGTVMQSLTYLDQLKSRVNRQQRAEDYLLIDQARRYQPTLFQCTPSMMRMLELTPDLFPALQSLRALMLGGEPLPPSLVSLLQQQVPASLHNMYGPTETTIWSATHAVASATPLIPIGGPIANTQLYILDAQLQPVPIGVVGELYIGGAGLARGYSSRPELTAQKFLPDPFCRERSGRMYRTGDCARWLPNGTIAFLGRNDHQVKIRGFRIELEEIEAVLAGHPAIHEAVVIAAEQAGDKQIIAYMVPHQASQAPPIAELRDYLRQSLPDYMIPAAFVPMQAFPVTPNGKIDRKMLPATVLKLPASGLTVVAPRNTLEQALAALWKEVLHIESVSVHDNFFDLGGHSLLLAQLQNKLRAQLSIEIALVKLMAYPTIAALADHLRADQREESLIDQSGDRAAKQLNAMRAHRQRMKI